MMSIGILMELFLSMGSQTVKEIYNSFIYADLTGWIEPITLSFIKVLRRTALDSITSPLLAFQVLYIFPSDFIFLSRVKGIKSVKTRITQWSSPQKKTIVKFSIS